MPKLVFDPEVRQNMWKRVYQIAGLPAKPGEKYGLRPFNTYQYKWVGRFRLTITAQKEQMSYN